MSPRRGAHRNGRYPLEGQKGYPTHLGDDPEERYLERGRAAMAAFPNQYAEYSNWHGKRYLKGGRAAMAAFPKRGRSALAAVPHQEQITGRKSTNSLGEMVTCKSKEGSAPQWLLSLTTKSR